MSRINSCLVHPINKSHTASNNRAAAATSMNNASAIHIASSFIRTKLCFSVWCGSKDVAYTPPRRAHTAQAAAYTILCFTKLFACWLIARAANAPTPAKITDAPTTKYCISPRITVAPNRRSSIPCAVSRCCSGTPVHSRQALTVSPVHRIASPTSTTGYSTSQFPNVTAQSRIATSRYLSKRVEIENGIEVLRTIFRQS